MGVAGVRLVWSVLVILVLGFQLSSAKILRKRSAGGINQLFVAGDEYRFNYEVLITTGTEEPISHAASYRLKGVLRVQGTSSDTITAQLEDLGIGLYNGQWSYFPVPSFEYIKSDDLNSLALPFQIVLENGKFKTLMMNDQEPEWASNMKRGLATYLQMNMEKVTPQKLMFFKDEELTTLGTCPTMYEVMPVTATGMGLARVSKFRNHADCPDVPSRIRHESRTYYPCHDDKTRDIMNSTSYAIYDLSVQNTKITIQKLTVLSSILYWPFTQNGPFLYSWYNMTLALENVGPISSPISPPESSMDHEDLTYVFEQSDYSDPEEDISDLKVVEPLFFHQTSHENEPEVVERIMEKCHETTASLAKSLLTAEVLDDLEQFHSQTPTKLVPLVSSLDYDSLTKCYEHYSDKAKGSEQESLEFQLFLDALSYSGTPSAALVIRDIMQKSATDKTTITRLIMSFPIAIRHPSEALANELDPIFELVRNPNLEPRIKTIVELSMATLISRSCRKNLCASTGLLEKYINYFEGKLQNSKSFEEQVVGVLGLGNLGLGRSLEKPFEIAQGLHPEFENTVRIQSIWSLRPLILEQRDRVMTSLLPVFFNRSETCETRTSVFSFLMGSRPDERVLHEIAYFMWSEPCQQTQNIVRSTLTLMSKTEYPCNPVGSYARTVLKYLPPGQIDRLRTASYALDYYDKANGFGRMVYVTMQKTGSSVIPVSLYAGWSSYIGGFSNSFMGVFIRLQGVEHVIEASIPGISEGKLEKVIEILSKIEIEERTIKPLRLELVTIYSGKAVDYVGADEKTLGSRIKSFITSLQDAGKKFGAGAAMSIQHSALSGGIRYQQPLEIGTPISIFANLANLMGLNSNVTKTSKAGGAVQTEKDILFQANVFASTGITNHIPAINTMLTVSKLRTSRFRLPLHSSSSSQSKSRPDALLNFNLFIPKATNPLASMVHATSEVTVRGDIPNGIADEIAEAKLKESCPACPMRKTVTKGDIFRRERELALPKPRLLQGVTAQVKYIDCEKDHSKAALFNKLRNFFSDTGKNTGPSSSFLAKMLLGREQALDTLFLSPSGETCGLKAIFAQDPAAPIQTQEVVGSISRRESKSPYKKDAFATFLLRNAGEQASETKVDIHLSVKETKQLTNLHQQLSLKGVVINGPSGDSGIACFDVDNRLRTSWDDPMAFSGNSEPSINQTITIKMGKFPAGEPNRQSSIQDLPCLTNHAEITFTGDAQRSQEQVEEAEASAVWPYTQCQADKASNLWPGKFIPPTKACELVTMEQTELRSANMSICYKIVKEARKRWAPLMHLAASFMSHYRADTVESDSSDHVHSPSGQHGHRASSVDSSVYASGDVEISMDLRKHLPKMDVHVSRNDGEENHYHDVDLSLLPSVLIPRPGPGRISPLTKLQRRMGIAGSCSISPSAVLTLDGLMYPISLSSECSILVSGDCSKRSQYAILARQMPNHQLAVIIQVQDTRIELQNPTTAIIDGTLKSFRTFEEFGKDDKFLIYTRNDEIYVSFVMPPITVRYTGSFITVDLSLMFRGVNCGLCGNWDTNPYNDLMGPKVCPRPLTAAEIVQAWVVREGQCTDVGQTCP